MRSFTHTTVPVEFRLDIGPGLVDVVAEDRTDATVTLAPERTGDDVAADLINRATHTADGDRFSVTVPRPSGKAANSGVAYTSGGVTVIQAGRFVSGTLTGVTITGDGNVYVGGMVAGMSSGGSVQATVRVPLGSRVNISTDTADIHTAGPLTALTGESVSGDVVHIGTVDDLDFRTVSGDITATARRANATTTSGDIRVTLHGSRADLRSVSGDISAHATTDATVTATSVSGDIRVTSTPGVQVRTSLRSVSGYVRTA